MRETEATEFDAIAERLAAKARERGDVEESPPLAVVRQLPIWPEPDRAAPNAAIRSALFAVVKSGERKQYEKQLLACWKGSEIRYTGRQLDQYDLDVWLTAIHLARVQMVGERVLVGVRGFLRAMDRKASGDAAKRLECSLDRLETSSVNIKTGGVSYNGGLVDAWAKDENTGRIWMRLNPELVAAFETGYTRLDWETRRALKTDLARWLHAYVQSHQATTQRPHRIGIAKLHELSGSQSELKRFRFNAQKAMSELERTGVVLAWSITPGDALEFSRRLSGLQITD